MCRARGALWAKVVCRWPPSPEEGGVDRGEVGGGERVDAGVVQRTASAPPTAAASCRLLPLLQQLLAVARQIKPSPGETQPTIDQHPVNVNQHPIFLIFQRQRTLCLMKMLKCYNKNVTWESVLEI